MTYLKYFVSPSVDADLLQQPFIFLRITKALLLESYIFFEDLLTYVICRLCIYLSWVESSLNHNNITFLVLCVNQWKFDFIFTPPAT